MGVVFFLLGLTSTNFGFVRLIQTVIRVVHHVSCKPYACLCLFAFRLHVPYQVKLTASASVIAVAFIVELVMLAKPLHLDDP